MSMLSPAQQSAFEGIVHALSVGNVLVLWGSAGSGKTTVLQQIQNTIPGGSLSIKDFVEVMRSKHPLAIEEAFFQLVMDALVANNIVYIDDLELLTNVVNGCGSYPRTGFLESPLTAIATYVNATHKKLVLVDASSMAVRSRAYQFCIGDYTVSDYEFLCGVYLDEAAKQLDFDKIFRFAPKLNAHQLKGACVWLRREGALTTERVIDYLRSQYLASNVHLGEVQDIHLHDLKGVDEVIQSLEANIILPLENDELAKEFQLQPKRGVLLAGPPGTGKTSVGRALAHRLKSKFFLVDGTVISGSQQFYYHIHQLFESAKQNAPSIIFIDDSDAIFESGEELGLYRYLLTMLDGLESASAGRVCVMLTAMNISHLPPALIRSGRIELWLEMQLPDAKARLDIFHDHFCNNPALNEKVELDQLVEPTEGFTGADLKRLVEDGKLLLAFEKAQGRPLQNITQYFLQAIETVKQNKSQYAEADAVARTQRAQRNAASTARSLNQQCE